MKFSKFVGHEKTEKIIQTIENLEENYNTVPVYLGFSVNKKSLKRIYDYFKSWFIRYHIPFKSINPYLTLYLLNNIPKDKREFINTIKNKSSEDIIFQPEDEIGSITIYKEKKIEFRLEYASNYDFEDVMEEIFNSFDIEIMDQFSYIRLFEIKEMECNKIFSKTFLDDMMFSCPNFPEIKLGNIGLLNKEKE
jgi:hypothetical protein